MQKSSTIFGTWRLLAVGEFFHLATSRQVQKVAKYQKFAKCQKSPSAMKRQMPKNFEKCFEKSLKNGFSRKYVTPKPKIYLTPYFQELTT